MLALAIISTIFVGLLLLTFIVAGAKNLEEGTKLENVIIFIINLCLVFSIVVTWILYAN